jgi:hypothetical protein
MHRLCVAGCLVLLVVGCGGGSLTLSEFAVEAEELVTVLRERIDTLDAEWESQAPTLDGAKSYWERRLQARNEFLIGLQALDPPQEAEELLGTVAELMSRLTAAEEVLAARVATLETVTEHGGWWDTPEGRAAQAVDEETFAICHVVQAEFDTTEQREAFAGMEWIPADMKEVIRVSFGCPK